MPDLQTKATSPLPSLGGISPDWLDAQSVAGVIRALEQRSMYPDRVEYPDRSDGEGPGIVKIQTHISVVFLTRDHAFKFKRPVNFGFADFTTLKARQDGCHAEVRLNGRLAKGVYLGVLPLYSTPSGFSFEPAGGLVDYCVVMRRLAEDSMLDHRLRLGRVRQTDLDRIAEVLAEFHRVPPDQDLRAFGGLAVIGENWEENFRQTEHLVGTALSPAEYQGLRLGVADFMTRNAHRLKSRVEGGFIRDGHGDLRCEHIHLGRDGIKIIDCIEFNDRFRYGDVANDLAFLLMDLAALGHPEFSRHLLEQYLALTGDEDALPLIPFYACYRAYVRGKVTGFKLRDSDLGAKERTATLKRCKAFFKLALSFAGQMRQPLLVMVAGLMGTGKSSLAEALARDADLPHHNSDAIRKELAGLGTGEGSPVEAGRPNGLKAPADFGKDLYTPAWNERTYAALFERGAEALRKGQSVVLDASFSRLEHRRRAYALAAEFGAEVVLVECQLDEAATLKRLRNRWASGDGPSDGRAELYPRQKAAFEPIEEPEGVLHLTVTTDRPPEVLARALLPKLGIPPGLFRPPRK